MAISCSSFKVLVFFCCALFFLCVADEVNKKDDNTKTIRDDDVKVKIHGASGKIKIARAEKDDKDDDKDGKDDDKDDKDSKDIDTPDKTDDVDVEVKDSVEKKDSDSDKDDKDTDDDKDDDDFEDTNDDLLTFELDDIKEKGDNDKDVADDKHSVDSFKDVQFQFSPVQTNDRSFGIPAINVNLTGRLEDTDANVQIMVYLFRRAGSITFGNETFQVQPGTVKFNIKISDWDFCENNTPGCNRVGQFLDLSMRVKSKGTPSEVDDDDDRKKAVCKDDKDDGKDKDDNDEDDDDDDDDCPHLYDMGGDSEMLLNKGVETDDGNYSPMPQGYPKVERDGDASRFVFRIPKFNKNVLLDPSVTPGEKKVKAGSAASWLQVNFVVAMLLQLVAIFAAQ